MTLSGRFATLYLTSLGLVLVGFSAALYLAARVYLDRQLGERTGAALAVLAAAAEVHPEGVEWEPRERVLTLGQDPGPDRVRWLVLDDQGRRLDRSPNLDDADLTPEWTPRPGRATLPGKLRDRRGRLWKVAQRTLRPDAIAAPSAIVDAPHGTFPPFLVLTVALPLDPNDAALAALGGSLVVLSLASWGLAALLCRRLTRRALRPLHRMVASARGLDANDPGWSLDVAGTGDELDDLGHAFNDLLARLHVAYERQRRFGSDASHQLRTPLTVLIGQVEVALRHERDAEEYRRVLRSALGRAMHLGQIVEALLFLGRAEGDATLPASETIELNAWVADHMAGRSEEASRVDGGPGPIRVRAHAPLLGQLLDNLLDNARKYGASGTPVVVSTRREGEVAVLAVQDAGPGLAAEEASRVFEPFYRAAQARREGKPGVGLGLTVVQRIAAAFGGSVRLGSEPGRGCRVEVRLPAVE